MMFGLIIIVSIIASFSVIFIALAILIRILMSDFVQHILDKLFGCCKRSTVLSPDRSDPNDNADDEKASKSQEEPQIPEKSLSGKAPTVDNGDILKPSDNAADQEKERVTPLSHEGASQGKQSVGSVVPRVAAKILAPQETREEGFACKASFPNCSLFGSRIESIFVLTPEWKKWLAIQEVAVLSRSITPSSNEQTLIPLDQIISRIFENIRIYAHFYSDGDVYKSISHTCNLVLHWCAWYVNNGGCVTKVLLGYVKESIPLQMLFSRKNPIIVCETEEAALKKRPDDFFAILLSLRSQKQRIGCFQLAIEWVGEQDCMMLRNQVELIKLYLNDENIRKWLEIERNTTEIERLIKSIEWLIRKNALPEDIRDNIIDFFFGRNASFVLQKLGEYASYENVSIALLELSEVLLNLNKPGSYNYPVSKLEFLKSVANSKSTNVKTRFLALLTSVLKIDLKDVLDIMPQFHGMMNNEGEESALCRQYIVFLKKLLIKAKVLPDYVQVFILSQILFSRENSIIVCETEEAALKKRPDDFFAILLSLCSQKQRIGCFQLAIEWVGEQGRIMLHEQVELIKLYLNDENIREWLEIKRNTAEIERLIKSIERLIRKDGLPENIRNNIIDFFFGRNASFVLQKLGEYASYENVSIALLELSEVLLSLNKPGSYNYPVSKLEFLKSVANSKSTNVKTRFLVLLTSVLQIDLNDVLDIMQFESDANSQLSIIHSVTNNAGKGSALSYQVQVFFKKLLIEVIDLFDVSNWQYVLSLLKGEYETDSPAAKSFLRLVVKAILEEFPSVQAAFPEMRVCCAWLLMTDKFISKYKFFKKDESIFAQTEKILKSSCCYNDVASAVSQYSLRNIEIILECLDGSKKDIINVLQKIIFYFNLFFYVEAMDPTPDYPQHLNGYKHVYSSFLRREFRNFFYRQLFNRIKLAKIDNKFKFELLSHLKVNFFKEILDYDDDCFISLLSCCLSDHSSYVFNHGSCILEIIKTFDPVLLADVLMGKVGTTTKSTLADKLTNSENTYLFRMFAKLIISVWLNNSSNDIILRAIGASTKLSLAYNVMVFFARAVDDMPGQVMQALLLRYPIVGGRTLLDSLMSREAFEEAVYVLKYIEKMVHLLRTLYYLDLITPSILSSESFVRMLVGVSSYVTKKWAGKDCVVSLGKLAGLLTNEHKQLLVNAFDGWLRAGYDIHYADKFIEYLKKPAMPGLQDAIKALDSIVVFYDNIQVNFEKLNQLETWYKKTHSDNYFKESKELIEFRKKHIRVWLELYSCYVLSYLEGAERSPEIYCKFFVAETINKIARKANFSLKEAEGFSLKVQADNLRFIANTPVTEILTDIIETAESLLDEIGFDEKAIVYYFNICLFSGFTVRPFVYFVKLIMNDKKFVPELVSDDIIKMMLSCLEKEGQKIRCEDRLSSPNLRLLYSRFKDCFNKLITPFDDVVLEDEQCSPDPLLEQHRKKIFALYEKEEKEEARVTSVDHTDGIFNVMLFIHRLFVTGYKKDDNYYKFEKSCKKGTLSYTSYDMLAEQEKVRVIEFLIARGRLSSTKAFQKTIKGEYFLGHIFSSGVREVKHQSDECYESGSTKCGC